METENLISLCKKEILKYISENTSIETEVIESDIFVVWKDYWTIGEVQHNAKSLQNQKIVLGVVQFPNTYFDVVYNGQEEKLYFTVCEPSNTKEIPIVDDSIDE